MANQTARKSVSDLVAEFGKEKAKAPPSNPNSASHEAKSEGKTNPTLKKVKSKGAPVREKGLHQTVGQCRAANPIVDRYVGFAMRILASAAKGTGTDIDLELLTHARSFYFAELNMSKKKSSSPATTGEPQKKQVPKEANKEKVGTLANSLTFLPSLIRPGPIPSDSGITPMDNKARNHMDIGVLQERTKALETADPAAKGFLKEAVLAIQKAKAIRKNQQTVFNEEYPDLGEDPAERSRRARELAEKAFGDYKQFCTVDSFKEYVNLKKENLLPTKKEIEKFSKSLENFTNQLYEIEKDDQFFGSISKKTGVPVWFLEQRYDKLSFPNAKDLGPYNPRIAIITMNERGIAVSGSLGNLLQEPDYIEWLTPTPKQKNDVKR